MRKSKTTFIVLELLSISLIAALLLLSATRVEAKTVKYNYTSHQTKGEHFLIPDEKGHVVALYERRGVAIFENEVAAIAAWGTAEIIKGQGLFQGYTIITFEDGSTWTLTHHGTLAPTPDEKLGSYKMKGELINGTGRFEGIKGEYSATGRRITPSTKDETKGDNWIEVTATYTLPKK